MPHEILEVGDTEILTVHDTVVELLEVAEQGVPGPPGASGAAGIELPFAWGDASPRTITVATAGKLVYGIEIHVSEAFDGTAAALTVGDAAQPDRLMSATQNDPSSVGAYAASPSHRYGADTNLLLTITPGGGATAGAGLLTIFIES